MDKEKFKSAEMVRQKFLASRQSVTQTFLQIYHTHAIPFIKKYVGELELLFFLIDRVNIRSETISYQDRQAQNCIYTTQLLSLTF